MRINVLARVSNCQFSLATLETLKTTIPKTVVRTRYWPEFRIINDSQICKPWFWRWDIHSASIYARSTELSSDDEWYSNTSLIRPPLIRILRNSGRFWPPGHFQVVFTPLIRILAISRRYNSDTFRAEIDCVRELTMFKKTLLDALFFIIKRSLTKTQLDDLYFIIISLAGMMPPDCNPLWRSRGRCAFLRPIRSVGL